MDAVAALGPLDWITNLGSFGLLSWLVIQGAREGAKALQELREGQAGILSKLDRLEGRQQRAQRDLSRALGEPDTDEA